jgi:hypothetical protein
MLPSPISLGSVSDQIQLQQSRAQQINQDFKQLSSSLHAGDMAAAQKAYSALQQLLPNQAPNSQQTTSGPTRLAAISKQWGKLSNREI